MSYEAYIKENYINLKGLYYLLMIERLIKPSVAEEKIWDVFLLGIMYSSVALISSHLIFQSYTSLVMIAFTCILSVPLMHGIIRIEEEQDIKLKTESSMLKHHFIAIKALMAMFLGFVVSYVIWFTFLPKATGLEIFKVQLQTIINVNTATGNFTNDLAGFAIIFSNNVRILFLCFVFSFFYGAGAIYILAWNASVMGAAIGNSIRTIIVNNSNSIGILNYFAAVSTSFIAYFLHGIPEISAFFIGGLAGGIISVAINNHEFGGPRFKKLARDAAVMCGIAVVVLVVAALIEIFISPHFL